SCSSPSTPADAGTDSGMTMPDTGALFALAPGEVAEIALQDGVGGERIATPSGTEKFVAIVGSTRFDGAKAAAPYSIATDSAQNAGPSTIVTDCSIKSDAWKNQPLPSETPPSGTTVMVGAKKTIQMSTSNGPENIDVQAIAVSKTAVVWADVTQAHPANLDMTFVTQFLVDFDDIIIPRERTIFGVESDFDGDGHIGLVFTPLTYQTAVAFFTQCDLQQGC